ncbi:hypothetical protein PPERSA_00942 [Pseudocohnilembus persalinus]|uniref:DM10 domain-containing protein n=1 Tax=Pseudocohnilembus persalinus TaxID=266149 RepID=A0A0V0R8F6_PSEPJ|nr:hypothetical protein PPERSA_00942 [Pseudocohnilembus persalinus]|eukprot:KRX10772.1 hypothetical protein PPERSA_00942 [Pseudocohnilembus persalinus]
MTSLNLPKTVPMLPGLMFQDTLKDNNHKTQQFNLINNTQCEKTNYIQEDHDPALLDSLRMKTPQDLTVGQRQQPINDYIPRIQPPWLKYDRQVLKFECFFQESVIENSLENYRIRPCSIYYYLSDGTIHVNEPRVKNSGITQGIFIKRQKVPKKLGEYDQYYTWKDLNIGMNINLFERVFRITNADSFTREFYEYMGQPLQAAEQIPKDNFSTHMELKDIKIPPPDLKEYKEYNEVKLGGGHPNGGLHKYLENDRKVLSFNVYWNDTSLEGGLNFYILNLFLADDTMEIKEVRTNNSGKDPFPLLLNRQKVPKKAIQTIYPGMTLKKEQFYTPDDLTIGNTIVVFGKQLHIYDCDEFTKEWYQVNKGINQVPISLPTNKGKQFYQPLPPYNGYGSHEDSLGSVYALQPKAPKKDINKMYTQDQYILRFEARLLSENKEDNQRQFIISFFCGDDSIMVYEIADKNSGIWKGKFLEKMKHLNPITGKPYTEKDFQIGETIKLNVYNFQLIRADEYTHKYMKSKPHIFKEADISQVIERVKSFARNYPNYNAFLIDLVGKLDQTGRGEISFDELANGMRDLKIYLTYQELYTLMRHFDKQGKWRLDMQELFVGLGGQKSRY